MANWRSIFGLRTSSISTPTSPRRYLSGSASIPVSAETAMKVSAFYRGVIYVSTTIAKIPWDIKNSKNEVLENDRVYVLLNLSPNPEMNAFSFKLKLVQDAIVHGNAYCEIERDILGRPVNIWPLDPLGMSLARDPNGNLVYKYTAGEYAYQASPPIYLDPKNVFHIKNFHTKDGLVGQGVVAYGQDVLGITLGADRMALGLYANAGLPSGVLESDKAISETAYQRLKGSWREQFGGSKAGGVAILEEGMKFNPIQLDPQVLQFIESRKFGVLEISRFLGVPPAKLFDNSTTSHANAENQNLEVVLDCVDAWATNFEMECDVKLLTNRFGGKYSQMDIYEVFRADQATRAEYFTKMMQAGAMTPNQVRNKEGEAPYKGGDRYFLATNNFTPMDRVDEVIDAQIAAKNAKQSSPSDAPIPKDPADTAIKKAALSFLENRK